jgi:hypothetical protein
MACSVNQAGCAKTRAFNFLVESSSQFGQSENQKCWRRLSEGNRETGSTLSWLAHVFTQPARFLTAWHCSSVQRLMRCISYVQNETARPRRPLRAGEVISPIAPGAVAAASAGIAPHIAARSRPPVRAGCRRRRARRCRRTRRQCAGPHPRRSLSLPSVATLTRSYASHAIIGVKRFSTTSLRFSPRDTRDRYLACRHLDAETLRRQSARAKPHPFRRAGGRRRLRRCRHLEPHHNCR